MYANLFKLNRLLVLFFLILCTSILTGCNLGVTSSDKAITSYSINGYVGNINGNNITVNMPYGTDPSNLVATFTTTGQSVSVGDTQQISGVTPNNFTTSVVYTVKAEDNSTTSYTVTVVIAQPSDKAITSYSLNGVTGTISNNNISIAMPYKTDVTHLIATFDFIGASVTIKGVTQVSGKTENDFTQAVVYTVNAFDGSKIDYTVTVTTASITSLKSSDGSFCALDSLGNIFCWGYNQNGELGNGNNVNESYMVKVYNPESVVFVNITGFMYNFCATSNTGQLYCWGDGSSGQLGNGSQLSSNIPVKVTMPLNPESNTMVKFTSISIGNSTICAVGDNGHVYCWGNNASGFIGDGTTTNALVPIQVKMEESGDESEVFVEVKISYYTDGATCALAKSGNIYCWGDSGNGDAGTGAYTSAITLATKVVMPSNGDKFAHLMPGLGTSSCALTTIGTLYCWGNNSSGQGSDGTLNSNNIPTAALMPQSESYVNVIPSAGGACAISDLGNIYCWGDGTQGQIGNETFITSQVSPAQAQSPDKVLSMTSSTNHLSTFCEIDVNHHVYCWGDGNLGQIGNGMNIDANVPTSIYLEDESIKFNQIIANNSTGLAICALSDQSDVYCWGDGSYGQLGNGATNSSPIPVQTKIAPQ